MKVTVAICVHNAVNSLQKCIDFLYKNTHNSQFDSVIVNDFSNKETQKYIKQLKFKNIKRVNTKSYTSNPNPNLGLNLNLAQKKMARTSAGLITLDSDVYVRKGWLEKIFAVYENQLNYGVKIGSISVIFVDKSGIHAYPTKYDLPKYYKKKFERKKINPFKLCHICHTRNRSNRTYCVKCRKKLVINAIEVGRNTFSCTFWSREALNCCTFNKNIKLEGLDVEYCNCLSRHGFKHFVATNVVVEHEVHASRKLLPRRKRGIRRLLR